MRFFIFIALSMGLAQSAMAQKSLEVDFKHPLLVTYENSAANSKLTITEATNVDIIDGKIILEDSPDIKDPLDAATFSCSVGPNFIIR